MSPFYFVLGNIPAKYRSRLNDINLVLLSPSALVQKYGYQEIALPLLHDVKLLETSGLNIKFEDQEHIFSGTVFLVVAHNSAAHASEVAAYVILVLLTDFVYFLVIVLD